MHPTITAAIAAAITITWHRLDRTVQHVNRLHRRLEDLEQTVDDGLDLVMTDLGRPAI